MNAVGVGATEAGLKDTETKQWLPEFGYWVQKPLDGSGGF